MSSQLNRILCLKCHSKMTNSKSGICKTCQDLAKKEK